MWCPLFRMCWMLLKSRMTSSFVMASHSFLVITHNSYAVFGSLFWTLLFNTDHKFSRIFRPGDCGGQSLRRQICQQSKKSIVDLNMWHGAPSCMNMKSLPMKGISVVSKIVRYFSEFRMGGHLHNTFVPSPFKHSISLWKDLDIWRFSWYTYNKTVVQLVFRHTWI